MDSVERRLKVDLIALVRRLIDERGITQTVAARLLSIGQPDLSKILRGHLHDVSVERLFKFLIALGQTIEIRITPKLPGARSGKITVQYVDGPRKSKAVRASA